MKQALASYLELPQLERQQLERQILSAPFDLSVPQLRFLLKAGFPFNWRDKKWLINYFELFDYQQKNGQSLPQRKGKTKSLALWCQIQRSFRNQGRLNLGKQRALNSIHFVWEPFQLDWQKQCEALEAYLDRGGELKASRSLQCWMNIVRKKWDQISASKQNQLTQLGFPRSGPFLDFTNQKYLKQLEEFYAREGNLVGVTNCQQTFIMRMLKEKRAGTIDPILKERLDKIGVAWTKKEDGYSSVWQMRFNQVQTYLKECSHSRQPPAQWENQTLANWVRLQFKNWQSRSPEQQRLFLSLDISPIPSFNDQWMEQYKNAQRLFENLGSYRRSLYLKSDKKLVAWIDKQIRFWESLSPDNQQKLIFLGINQTKSFRKRNSIQWVQLYQGAVAHFDQQNFIHRSCAPRNHKIESWLRTQILAWHRLTLDQQEKIKPLALKCPPRQKKQAYYPVWNSIFGTDKSFINWTRKCLNEKSLGSS